MSRIVMSEPLRALIIGCGAIAGGYDPGGEGVLTHAKAYERHPAFTLQACIEPDAERRRQFMAQWQVPEGFASLDALSGDFDVVSLCTPTATHAALLGQLLNGPGKLIWAEKPLTDDLEASDALVKAYGRAGKPIAVNYLRRWMPGLQDLRAEISGGRWGALQKAVVNYGKGVLNNGSHALDLLRFLFGPLHLDRVLGGVGDDRIDQDATLDVRLLTAAGCPILLLGSDHRHYSLFEIQMIFAEGRVTLGDSAFVVSRQSVAASARFPGYRTLAPEQTQSSGMDLAMLRALDNIAGHLRSGEPLLCDGGEALETQKLCAAIAESWAIAKAKGEQ